VTSCLVYGDANLQASANRLAVFHSLVRPKVADPDRLNASTAVGGLMPATFGLLGI